MKTPPSGCTWYQSRICTNVIWPVPTSQVQSVIYDKIVLDDINEHIKFTGSRTCRRWYTDFKCRSAFRSCTPTTGETSTGAGPCRSECFALERRCPSLTLDCSKFPTSGCATRKQLGLPDSLTPSDKPFNTNAATATIGNHSSIRWTIMIIAAILIAVWTW